MNPKMLRLASLRAEAREISARLASAADDADTTADVTRASALIAEIETLASEVDAERATSEDVETRRAAARAARDRLAALGAADDGGTGTGTVQVIERERPVEQTVAQRFTSSPQFRAYLERGLVGQVAVDLPDVTVRALVDTTSHPKRVPYVGVVTPQDRPLRIADLIDRQQTGANSVPYVIESTSVGVAAEVAEGAQKPEAVFTFTETEAPVRTIAHWVPITRQAAEDELTLVGYIEGRLSYGLDYRLDGQILAGSGVAPNLRGLVNITGLGVYSPAAAENRLITIRKAITVAQLSEYQPDTCVLNPQDWQAIELDVDNTGSFRVTMNVTTLTPPRLWGLNVVATTVITAGTYLLGAFRIGATLWERQGMRLLVSDSHGTNFTANILVLLAEMRAALTVWRPAAFVKGTFSGAL